MYKSTIKGRQLGAGIAVYVRGTIAVCGNQLLAKLSSTILYFGV